MLYHCCAVAFAIGLHVVVNLDLSTSMLDVNTASSIHVDIIP